MRCVQWFVALAVIVSAIGVAQGQTRPVVVRASTVLDGKGGILRDVALVIEGSRIVRIDPKAVQATYDLRGLTVMPGWIDTHTHIVTHFDRETGIRRRNSVAHGGELFDR
jgi:imidazolonepropionase-like amidohydrolase